MIAPFLLCAGGATAAAGITLTTLHTIAEKRQSAIHKVSHQSERSNSYQLPATSPPRSSFRLAKKKSYRRIREREAQKSVLGIRPSLHEVNAAAFLVSLSDGDSNGYMAAFHYALNKIRTYLDPLTTEEILNIYQEYNARLRADAATRRQVVNVCR
ncbi:hypothetical protein ACFLJF_003145 [Salmonella enterica]